MTLCEPSTPAYKTLASSGSAYAPTRPTGLVSLLGTWLGVKPAYKTLEGELARARPSSGLLQILVGRPPSYKTAPAASPELPDEPGPEDDDVDDDACASPTDTVIVL